MPIGPRRQIGDILIDEGAITQENLEEALVQQKETGGALGRVLQDMGLVTESQLLMALGTQLDMDVIDDLDSLEISPDVLAMVSKMMAEVYNIIPVSMEENELVCAMADPLNVHALDDLRFMLNCNVRGAVCDHNQVRNAIEKFYGQTEDDNFENLISELGDEELIEIGDEDTMSDVGQLEDLANLWCCSLLSMSMLLIFTLNLLKIYLRFVIVLTVFFLKCRTLRKILHFH
jgi:type IV pilus assembly protein PilB